MKTSRSFESLHWRKRFSASTRECARWSRASFFLVTFLSASACSAHQDDATPPPDNTSETAVLPGGGPEHKWVLVPVPPDLSTDIQDGPIGVLVTNSERAGGRPPTEAELSTLSEGLWLTTEDGSHVEVRNRVVMPPVVEPTGADGDLGDRPDNERHVLIELVPLSPLKPIWHTIRLKQPSPRYLVAGFTRTGAPEGQLLVRFHPHPIPLYRQVRIMADSRDKPRRVEIEFSQTVDSSQMSSASVLCGLQTCHPMLAQDGTSAHSRIWQFECLCADGQDVTIEIHHPLQTRSSEVVTTLRGELLFKVTWPSDPRWERDGDFVAITP